MNELGYLLAGAHNERIASDIERKLNDFVEAVNRAGGKCWIQAKSNKEHYYELTEPVSFNYYMPVTAPGFEVRMNSVAGIVKEKENESER